MPELSLGMVLGGSARAGGEARPGEGGGHGDWGERWGNGRDRGCVWEGNRGWNWSRGGRGVVVRAVVGRIVESASSIVEGTSRHQRAESNTRAGESLGWQAEVVFQLSFVGAALGCSQRVDQGFG